jgi:hypothetical protein
MNRRADFMNSEQMLLGLAESQQRCCDNAGADELIASGTARQRPERAVARQRLHANELCIARTESEAINNFRRK